MRKLTKEIREEKHRLLDLMLNINESGNACIAISFSGYSSPVWVKRLVGTKQGETLEINQDWNADDNDRDLPKIRFIRHELECLLAECEAKGEAA